MCVPQELSRSPHSAYEEQQCSPSVIQSSIRGPDPGTAMESQGVSPPAPLASPLEAHCWFSWADLFLQGQQPNRPCKPSPRGVISQICPDVHKPIPESPSHDPRGSGRRKEVEMGEELDKSKPQPWALLPAVLSLFPWAFCGCCTTLGSCLPWHSLHPLRRHRDWGLSVLCNLKPHKGQGFVFIFVS